MAVLTFANPTPPSQLSPVLPDGAKLITPSDADTFERPVNVWVGATSGNVVCTPANGGTNVTIPVAANSYLPVRVIAVLSTGTTATTLHAVY